MTTTAAPRAPARTRRMRARFEGTAHEESSTPLAGGSEIAFRITITRLHDATPLADVPDAPSPSGPLLPDQRVELPGDPRAVTEWAWNVEVESYDFDLATRRITGTLRYDVALPPPPPPPLPAAAPVAVAPAPLTAPAPIAPSVVTESPRPRLTPTATRPVTPIASPSARLPLPDSTRWLRVLLLALLGLWLTFHVHSARGVVHGVVMGAVTVLVLWFVTRARRE